MESAPKKNRLRIIKRIQDLSSDPRPPGCEKLSGHDDKHRVRQGTHRNVYSISDVSLIICIVKVGHRKDVYR
ncbi:MAG: type II toxin-antitoxin system RelE/ParE family toxin [bacterium]